MIVGRTGTLGVERRHSHPSRDTRCTLRNSWFTRGFQLMQPVPREENHLVVPLPFRSARWDSETRYPLRCKPPEGLRFAFEAPLLRLTAARFPATRSGRSRARVRRWELLNRFVQFPWGDRGILPFAVCYIAAATLSSYERRRRRNTSVQRYPTSYLFLIFPHIYRALSLACLLLAKV